jgi:hypothetical protein
MYRFCLIFIEISFSSYKIFVFAESRTFNNYLFKLAIDFYSNCLVKGDLGLGYELKGLHFWVLNNARK